MTEILEEFRSGKTELKYPKIIKDNVHAQAFYGVVSAILDETISIAYDDIESFDELVIRIYVEVLEYARDCYRKEYLEEHTEVKIYDVNDFYGKWIKNFKPNQVRGIEQGDFIAVKVKYTDGSGFDIKVGWYDKSIKDNGYNIFVSNVDGEYKITAWCPMPKVK